MKTILGNGLTPGPANIPHPKLKTALLPGLMIFAGLAPAQYRIDWFKTAGGGGTSTGGAFKLQGTIGQPNAGETMAGGAFSLAGGFWVLPVVVQSSNAPTLFIAAAAPGFATIWWSPAAPGFVLQSNLSLTNTDWSVAVSGATNPVVVPASQPALYYRLIKQ